MKRFCILACIAVLSISLFGGAISPQKTHAQITQANKLQLEGFAKEVIDIEKNLYEQKFFANPENAEPQIQLGARYLEILQKTYDEVSKDPTKTPAFFNFKTSTAYLNFLDAEIASNSGGPSLNVKTSTYQEVVQRVRIIANQRNLLDIASLNAEQGKITNANKIELKNAANNASAAANAAAAEKAAAEECSLISNSPIIGCLNQAVTWLIKNTLLEIAGFFTWLTANMFNFAIKLGILGFAKWAPDSLYPIWTIVRQILSLIIVFIGLYLGLMYIIGKDQLFAKFFPWVILFALFVNFSYTLTRTAIDVSNVISLKIYASVVGPGALDENPTNTAGAQILSKLGLERLSAGAAGVNNNDMIGSITSVPAALLAVIYVFFAGYIFFMVTSLIILRTAALVFLIVVSPFLLIDSVLPILGEKAKMLRKIFFEQLVVAPVFMIMLALTLKFLDVFSSTGAMSKVALNSSSTQGSAATVATFFNILMMLIMLWITYKVTKSTAGAIGNYATEAMGTVGGFAVGAASGGAGFLARKGIGAAAMKLRDSKWVTNNQDSARGRLAYNFTNSLANSTFDVRNSAVAQKFGSKIGIPLGMGATMGYEEASTKKVTDLNARASRIKTRYERDVIKDGKILHRKGDINEEGVEALKRFHETSAGKNGSVFSLNEREKANLSDSYVDQTSESHMKDYAKQDTREAKAKFLSNLNEELAKMQGEGKGSTPHAQALMRSIHDIEENKKKEDAAFNKQIDAAYDKYIEFGKVNKEKAASYLANLDKELRDAVKQKMSGTSSSQATTSPATRTSQSTAPSTRTAESIAKEIEDVKRNATTSTILDANGKQMLSSEDQKKIATLEQERNALINNKASSGTQSGSNLTSSTTPQVFDISKVDFTKLKSTKAANDSNYNGKQKPLVSYGGTVNQNSTSVIPTGTPMQAPQNTSSAQTSSTSTTKEPMAA